jgi:hypothetical protein
LFKLVFEERAPYTVLSTSCLSYKEVMKVTRFAKFWDLLSNSGEFVRTLKLWREKVIGDQSYFSAFMDLSEFLYQRHGQIHSIPLLALAQGLWDYLKENPSLESKTLARALLEDYAHGATRRDVPRFLRDFVSDKQSLTTPSQKVLTGLERQKKHLQ